MWQTILPWLIILAGYLLGAIPFGYVIGRVIYKKDIRKEGSHNIGATNVWRVLGWLPAIATFILDSAKGAVVVWVMRYGFDFSMFYSFLAGVMVVVGHCFSYLLGFRGGKGVATAYGVMAILFPLVTAMMAVIWLVAFAVTRISAVASLTAWGWAPVLFYFFGLGYVGTDMSNMLAGDVVGLKSMLLLVGLSLLIYIRHGNNIIQLWKQRRG